MIFTDGLFFVFFAGAFSIYWLIPANGWRKVWLLACSMLFYAAWDWRFLGLIFLVIVNTYVVTLLIAATSNEVYRRYILTAGIVFSLGVLAYFKYFNFFIESLSQLRIISPRVSSLVLPLGISFFTFHSISYMADTFRRRIQPTWNLVDVALYILFFPQLVAGPIVRATDLLPQMKTIRSFASVNVKFFLLLFLIGYFKKAVISDNVAPLVDLFFANPQNYAAGDAALAVFFYSVQIYCDFSGYTDMAIAAAGLLGYRLKPNFNHPYLSVNLIEFWRRWHMSLSAWLRDYLYIPLGGNRGGAIAQARNVLITMLLGGLWHGASWTFVAWGGLHGIGLIVCHAWQAMVRGKEASLPPRYSLAGNILTFTFVAFAWIFFRANSFESAGLVIQRFASPALPTLLSWQLAILFIVFLITAHVGFYRLNLEDAASRIKNDYVFAALLGGALAAILPFINANVQPFIYFQF